MIANKLDVLFICIQRSQLAQSTDSVINRKMDAHRVTSNDLPADKSDAYISIH